MTNVKCIGCGGLVPDIAGPTHPYMESSHGCWSVYGEVLAREYSEPALMAVHRLTSDTYAVQHPGRPSRQSTQSVCGHLLRLCLVLELGAHPSYTTRVLRAVLEGKAEPPFFWLEPPRSLGEITVADVRASASAAEHDRKVRAWAECVWSAWADHHAVVRGWAAAMRS